ncbi:MAG: disulfide oxidoreductase, partial [Ignavibacteria bacterium]|nr:disulfide oxidoreductase [Ignavibacteria bacterium]MCU7514520.1 disulfide oxidoreductase [Ignavibacteria bacterium]
YLIVEILRMVPSSLPFLIKKGLCGLGCIETDTDSLEAVAKRKGFSDEEIDSIVKEINRLSRNGG